MTRDKLLFARGKVNSCPISLPPVGHSVVKKEVSLLMVAGIFCRTPGLTGSWAEEMNELRVCGERNVQVVSCLGNIEGSFRRKVQKLLDFFTFFKKWFEQL